MCSYNGGVPHWTFFCYARFTVRESIGPEGYRGGSGPVPRLSAMGPPNGTSWTVMICNIRKWTSCAPTHALWHASHNCKKFRWWCGLDDYQSRAVTPLYYPSGMASWRQGNKEKGKCHAVGSRLTGAECLALLMGASQIRCRSEGTWMVSTLSRRWRARPSTLLASACGRRGAVRVDKAVDGVAVVYVSIARYLSIADKFSF